MIERIEKLRQDFIAKVERDQGATCAHCLAEPPKNELASIGMFIPNDTGITGKTRVVVYAVCAKCWRLPEKSRAQKIEDTLVRSGIFLRPEEEGGF